jgi:multicomponent Na+:H+ antiporter subunit E
MMVRRRIDLSAVVWLTGVWVFLWGRFDVPVVLSGVVLGTVMCVLAPLPQLADPLRARPLAVVSLGWYVGWDLLRSSVQVTWQIMRPARPRSAVLAVPLRCRGDVMAAMTAIAVSAVPGTTVIDVRREDWMMILHVLDVDESDVDTVRADVWKLERLIVRAFGTRAQVQAMGSDTGAWG